MQVVMLSTTALSATERRSVRAVLDAAFDSFTQDDWEHALGGVHALACTESGTIVGHASVVPRRLYVGDVALDGGYVEGVAVAPAHQGRGIGGAVMTEINAVVAETYPLAALSTSRHAFYERLGWKRWRGPTYVVSDDQWRRTADEDGGVMVLTGRGAGATVELADRLAVDARAGDDW